MTNRPRMFSLFITRPLHTFSTYPVAPLVLSSFSALLFESVEQQLLDIYIPTGSIELDMSTAQEQNEVNAQGYTNKEINGLNGVNGFDHAPGQNSLYQRKPYDYGGNPLAHINTGGSVRLPAFGGEFQPGLYKGIADRKFANPAPLGLSAFALTTFILSLVNLGTRGLTEPNIVVGAAFAYGGLAQLLAGMW